MGEYVSRRSYSVYPVGIKGGKVQVPEGVPVRPLPLDCAGSSLSERVRGGGGVHVGGLGGPDL